jgi:hypothetical protein
VTHLAGVPAAVPHSWLDQALVGPRLVVAMQDSMAAACGQVVRNTTVMQVCCALVTENCCAVVQHSATSQHEPPPSSAFPAHVIDR